MTKEKMEFLKDLPNKKITVTRLFDAPVTDVWRAWTESDLLELWWAPKPWRAETKHMDFREGGHWLYAMVGPDNTKHWARIDYSKIDLHKSYEATDLFTDENGVANSDLPNMIWKNSFHKTDEGTKVVVEILFKSEEDIKTIVEMGFKEGFTSALDNLEEYFRTLQK